MVIETKLTLCLNDIEALEFECKKCHALMIAPITELLKVPERCISCTQVFMDPAAKQYDMIYQIVQELRKATVEFAENNEKSGLILRLVLKGSSAEKIQR